MILHVDTHVVGLLFAGKFKNFPRKVAALIEQNVLAISPVVSLELQYLYEINRVSEGPEKVIAYLNEKVGLVVLEDDFMDVMTESISITWTRDVFDRMIVGQAQLNKATLITKDSNILDNYSKAVWE